VLPTRQKCGYFIPFFRLSQYDILTAWNAFERFSRGRTGTGYYPKKLQLEPQMNTDKTLNQYIIPDKSFTQLTLHIFVHKILNHPSLSVLIRG